MKFVANIITEKNPPTFDQTRGTPVKTNLDPVVSIVLRYFPTF